MGADKSTLMHASGRTFLQHSSDRLADVCDDVVVSGIKTVPNHRVIIDSISNRGPAIGVMCALEYAKSDGFDACFVTAIDMPDLTVEDLIRVKRKWQSQPHRLVCVMSESDHRLQPLVAIYPITYLDELRELSRSEDRSLQRWLQTRPHMPVKLSATSCRNVNRPEDL
jgi:molybdopterin-guanine dinucleotide biosynthesis protein A